MRRIFDKNRANYKRKYGDGGCVFCGKDEILECPGLTGRYWTVLVNRYPYMNGNLMIIPKRHVEKLEEINETEWKEFFKVFKKTQATLSDIFNTQSFNVGINIGPESGASIPHLHWQVIPRFRDNYSVTSVLGELYPVTVSPEETKRLVDEKFAGSKAQ
jgi:ATP adenylyltransferase